MRRIRSFQLVFVGRTDDEIPEGGTDSETGFFSSEVVLVMVLLQLVEPAALVLGSVDVVQRVVHQIVCHVANGQEGPEKGKQGRVSDGQELGYQREDDGSLHHE